MTILPIPTPDDEATDGTLDRHPALVDGRHLPSVFHAVAPDDRPVLARRPAPTPEPARLHLAPATPNATPAPAPTPARRGRLARRDDDRGQATAEYGLVILVAGLIALGVIAWARGTGSFTDMFENIINNLTSAV